MKPFRLWMLNATTLEQEELARKARVSRSYLYQLADGRRDALSETAGKIADAAEHIRKSSNSDLPVVTRADISTVCGQCNYARRCIGSR